MDPSREPPSQPPPPEPVPPPSAAPAPSELSRGVRRAARFAMVLGGLMGLRSASEMSELANLEALRNLQPSPSLQAKANAEPADGGEPAASTRGEGEVLFVDPKLLEAALKAQGLAMANALESMKDSRTLVLLVLSVVSALIFVSGARLLRPGIVPRSNIGRLLGGAALVGAVLRTIDGAQLAAVSKRVGSALDRVMTEQTGQATEAFAFFSVGLSMLGTLLFAGSLAALSAYLRSDKVKAELASADKHPPALS